MRKWQELQSPSSCLNKAGLDELIFVLLGRDTAAPVAIRAWADERVRNGKNKASDEQIRQALETAAIMERSSPFWQPAAPDAPIAGKGGDWRTLIIGLPTIRRLLNGEDVSIDSFKISLIPDDVLFNARPARPSGTSARPEGCICSEAYGVGSEQCGKHETGAGEEGK